MTKLIQHILENADCHHPDGVIHSDSTYSDHTNATWDTDEGDIHYD